MGTNIKEKLQTTKEEFKTKFRKVRNEVQVPSISLLSHLFPELTSQLPERRFTRYVSEEGEFPKEVPLELVVKEWVEEFTQKVSSSLPEEGKEWTGEKKFEAPTLRKLAEVLCFKEAYFALNHRSEEVIEEVTKVTEKDGQIRRATIKAGSTFLYVESKKGEKVVRLRYTKPARSIGDETQITFFDSFHAEIESEEGQLTMNIDTKKIGEEDYVYDVHLQIKTKSPTGEPTSAKKWSFSVIGETGKVIPLPHPQEIQN